MSPARRALAFAFFVALVVACGSRTGLLVAGLSGAPKSSAFCARGSYESGHSDVTLFVLLDRSYSMSENGKWDEATAAVASLARDPGAAGMGFGLQFFPAPSDECKLETYEQPAVPVDILPANADRVASALAGQTPEGTTPTWPALRGAIEQARALRLAEPTRDVVLVLVTDGEPSSCASLPNSAPGVAALALEAATSAPAVRTYVIGLVTGDFDKMNAVAAAGGSGRAISVGADPSSAQQLVTTLKALRDDDRLCRFAVPAVGTKVSPYELGVALTPSAGSAPVEIPLVGAASKCGGDPGFFVDDPSDPRRFTLCPASCTRVHGDGTSRVDVSVGCGAGADAAIVDFDAGPCSSMPDVACKSSCESPSSVTPVCERGSWVCPAGSVSQVSCETCPAVPHGCCKDDGTLAASSCISGAWVCPPGAALFGSSSCSPPRQCAPTMPCASGFVCRAPDTQCGARAIGACVAKPATCAGGAPACGCDGKVYATECAANQAGVDVGQGCAAPSGDVFACGAYFCRRADEICRRTFDAKNTAAPTSFACVPAAGCSNGCNCGLCGACSRPSCVESCTDDGSGGRQVTCTRL